MATERIWSIIRQRDLVFCLKEIKLVTYIEDVPKVVIKNLLSLLLTYQ